MDYNETDAITTYMKDSLSVCKGKFFSKKNEICNLGSSTFTSLRSQVSLFVDEHHITFQVS